MSEDNPRSTPEMLDRYELISLLARGGMGSVHLARLPGVGGFQRMYAIKLMHPHLAEEAEFIAMLLDEARIAARIHHPNAVPIVDICQSDRGFYLVMDYIDGVNLARLLQRATSVSWRERVRVSVRIVIDALRGLHAAHELTDDDGTPLGLVHRDVSPQNILVGTDGVGRITDFGIALAASRISASRPGMIKGKPSYMSPEQVSAGTVHRRADVFATGIVLWEALTGHRLFQADTEMGALMQVITGEIVPPRQVLPELPAALEVACMRALERDPLARYETGRAMAERLEAAAIEHNLLGSSHEVADLLQRLFAEDIAKRRNLIRHHARAVDGTASFSASGPGRGTGDAERPVSNPSRPGITTGKTARSLPAIEVSTPIPRAVVEASVVRSAPASSRRGLVFGVGAFVVVAAGGGWLALRTPTTPVPVVVNQPPVTAVTTPPVQPPAPTPVVVPAVAPEVVAAVDAGAVAVAPAEPPVEVPGPAEAPRRTPRAEVRVRPERTPTPAVPAVPSTRAPAIESNPYLQR